MVFRTLTAKLAAMGVVMATIALLFTGTLIAEGTSQIFRAIFRNRSAQNTCYDLLLGSEEPDGEKYRACLEQIRSQIPLRVSLQYDIYKGQSDELTSYIEANTTYYRYYNYDTLLCASDYAALRSMLGYPEVTMEPGEYLIHCQPYVAEAITNWSKPVTAGGQTLTLGGVYTEILGQYFCDVNGQGFILVVPDKAAKKCAASHRVFAAMTEEPVSKPQYEALEECLNKGALYNYQHFSGDKNTLYVKTREEADAAAMTAMLVFPLYYLALALTMTAATILTIQQLCEAGRYRRQFELLGKLGMERKQMVSALRWQLAVYYAMPAAPAFLVSVPFVLNLAKRTEPGIISGASDPLRILGTATSLFFLIYGIYILMAYITLRRSVLPE